MSWIPARFSISGAVDGEIMTEGRKTINQQLVREPFYEPPRGLEGYDDVRGYLARKSFESISSNCTVFFGARYVDGSGWIR